jgi:uncharacterized protein with LGFP repeats
MINTTIKHWMLQRYTAVALTLGVLASGSVAKAVVAVQREPSSTYLPGSKADDSVAADEMKKKAKKKAKKKKSRSS